VVVEDDQPVKLRGVMFDITQIKQAEKVIQESEERFRLLNEAIPQQVWTARPDGSLDYVNPRVIEYFGCPFEEMIGQGWQQFLHPEDLPGCLERWDKALESKQPYETEFRLLRGKDRSFRWHLGRAIPIFDQDGEVAKWFGTNTDITQLKQLESQVRQSQKMEAIGTLAGGIAHDFNNILMAITGYTELAKLNARGNSPAQRNLEEVLVAGQRAKELVQQILTFSRQAEHEQQPIELKLVVKEVCRFLRASLPATVQIRQNFTKVPTIILGDPIQMHQVIMNLCANAEHAMRKSGGLLELKVEHVAGETHDIEIHPVLKGDSYVRLTVRDTGAGMTQDVVQRIFDPFFTTKKVGEGTGLGLAVVHGIVTSHGGCINVESEPGQGATFTIDFPEMEPRSIQGENTPLQQELLMGHGNILFVEDEEPLARLGEEAMRNLGYEVMVRTSSVEALETFRANPYRFNAVVTDQTMPNMTGEALSRELLQIRPDVPIILCTGFSHSMTLEKAKAMGIRAFLLKPLLIEDLGRTLQEVLPVEPKSEKSGVLASLMRRFQPFRFSRIRKTD
jgi:PAS domain S-box-containing protein